MLAAAAMLGPAQLAGAQAIPEQPHVQGGLGLLPGAGIEVGWVGVRNLFTREGVLLVDVSPGFAGGEGSVQLSGALGGSLRLFSIARFFNRSNTAADLDVGARFGPSLFFAFGDASREVKNQRFSLFLEPFARFSTTYQGRAFFVEAGSQRPLVRFGLWFAL